LPLPEKDPIFVIEILEGMLFFLDVNLTLPTVLFGKEATY
jgi:hypothetical protein